MSVAGNQLNTVSQSVLVRKLVGNLIDQSVTPVEIVKLVHNLVTFVVNQLGNDNGTSLGHDFLSKDSGVVHNVRTDTSNHSVVNEGSGS